MLPYFRKKFSNPSAIYSFAQEGKKAGDNERKQVADLIGAKTEEFFLQPEDVNRITGRLRQQQRLACTSGSLEPSHVLLAIGLPHEIAHDSLRISLSEDTTMEESDYVVDESKY